MKVLFIITDLDVGGAELAMLRFARFLRAETPWELEVISLMKPGTVARDLGGLGISVETVNMSGLNAPLAFLRALGLIRHSRADVVCSFMFHANTVAQVARMLKWAPTVLSFERTMSQDSVLRRLVKSVASRYADEVIAVSPAVREYCTNTIKMPSSKVRVLGNGVDLNRFAPRGRTPELRRLISIPDDAVVITCVANLRPVKAQSTLVAAFGQLAKRFPHATLILVGDGPDRAELEELAAKLQISSRAHFLGQREDVADILAATDIFVMPSVTEGMSNAIIEAMASECAIVATAVGGTPDIITDDRTGLLVPPASPVRLGGALATLIEDPALRKRLAKAAASEVRERHSMEAIGQQFVQLLASHTVERLNPAGDPTVESR